MPVPQGVAESSEAEAHAHIKVPAPHALSITETITRAVEEAVRNALGGKGNTRGPGKCSARRKRVEDKEVMLEKQTEHSEHRDYVLVCLFYNVQPIVDDIHRKKSATYSKMCPTSHKILILFPSNQHLQMMYMLLNMKMDWDPILRSFCLTLAITTLHLGIQKSSNVSFASSSSTPRKRSGLSNDPTTILHQEMLKCLSMPFCTYLCMDSQK
jgi:hypothetical protein